MEENSDETLVKTPFTSISHTPPTELGIHCVQSISCDEYENFAGSQNDAVERCRREWTSRHNSCSSKVVNRTPGASDLRHAYKQDWKYPGKTCNFSKHYSHRKNCRACRNTSKFALKVITGYGSVKDRSKTKMGNDQCLLCAYKLTKTNIILIFMLICMILVTVIY